MTDFVRHPSLPSALTSDSAHPSDPAYGSAAHAAVVTWARRVVVVVLVALLALAGLGLVRSASAGRSAISVAIEVEESPESRLIADHVPDTLLFTDRMGAAAVADVDDVAGSSGDADRIVDFQAGDVVWWVDDSRLVVFTHETSVEGGIAVVRVGTVRSGLADLTDCIRCDVALSFGTR